MTDEEPLTDVTEPSPPRKAAAKKAAAAPEAEARPVHVLVALADGPDNAEKPLADFEIFTSEIVARRALDNRPGDWRYVQVVPGSTFRAQKRAQQQALERG